MFPPPRIDRIAIKALAQNASDLEHERNYSTGLTIDLRLDVRLSSS
jgi:hypothetical protein